MIFSAGFFVALRYLLGRAHEGGRYLRGAAAGIAVSLVPIVVTLIVADGMIRGITDRFLELGTAHIQVYNFTVPGKLPEAAAAIAEIPGIRGVWLERQGLGMLVGSEKRGATIRALENSYLEDPGSLRFLKIIEGTAVFESDRDVLLGQEIAGAAGAGVGDRVRIMTLRTGAGGRSIPRFTSFTVRGIVSSGYRELDSLWCIITEKAGASVFSPELSSVRLMVKIDDPYRRADRVMLDIYRILGPDFSVYTWKELQRSQYSSYEQTRQLLLFIMALIVMVAAVNVSSATSMLVIERQRDIAVLKAGGAGNGCIQGIFLWGSLLTGLTGSVLGIGAGLLIGRFVNPIIKGLENILSFFSGLFHGSSVKLLDPGYYLETIPVIIDWKMIFLIGFFTILCSVTASFLPAYRAGRLKPLELLRKY